MYCYLGLGSNLGNKQNYITNAIKYISELENVEIKRTSSIITTKPYGKIDQPDFLNCVVELNTNILPEELLKKCLNIEDQLGRSRKGKWGPRTIDIDMLFYEDKIMNTKLLVLPHPELHKREFVLISLSELCPDLIHPIINKKIKDIFLELK
ncbi:MAG: 2-amino-4-hydroxy-6-hydroxymethyldihydropteridine diphosphokinase [Candidatus Tenebribacter burtonii]|nr:2-amino-4-hydroxy-6-hydroxymethyldihydropteridine diphosphokinase [Candidatus Tenebribacter burtonii]